MTQGHLYRLLAGTASRHPDSPAITFLRGGNAGYRVVSYTFDQLFTCAEELGAKLESVYEDRSAPLGLLLYSQEDQVLHYLAGLSIGVVPAILTPPNRKLNREYYQETMRQVLRRCRFGGLVSDVDGVELDAVVMQPFTFVGQSAERISDSTDSRSTPLQASFMQFSSGTTGIKRGVLVSDDAVSAQLETYAAALDLDSNDCIVSWLPLYHDMGFIACLNMPLAHGVHTVMLDPIDWVSDPALYLRTVSDYRGTLSWHPNFAFQFMAQRVSDAEVEGADLSSLRGLINCSEPVTHQSQQSFMARFEGFGLSQEVFKGCYAMAETTFALTHGKSGDSGYLDSLGPTEALSTTNEAFVSVGHPLPGVELSIRNTDSGRELDERAVGEIWVRSPFNFLGYYNDSDATRQAFVDDWYRTGDLGYRAGDEYFVVGRLKDVLIVGGVNVFPQDIEELVSRVERVKPGRVSAFSTFDERIQTERITVIAESEHHDAETARDIVVEIRQRVLSAFQIANFDVHLVPFDWMVKSTSGKVARGANREKWLATDVHPQKVAQT